MEIAVYCGSSLGNHKSYIQATKDLGEWIVKSEHTLIYGGGNIGLMGILADTVLAKGGKVTGIMPTFLMGNERAHTGLTTFIEVEDMSKRKQLMLSLSNVCIALPGGPGTLEEIIEAISWLRIGQSTNTCIFLNINQYYHPLKELLYNMVTQGFLDQNDYEQILFVESVEELDTIILNISLKYGYNSKKQ